MNDDINKSYYKIRDAAEIVGVATSTLRYWETEFPEIKPKRSTSGARYYTPDDLEKLRMIHYLVKVKGLKLEAAKEQMRSSRNSSSREMDVIRKLEKIKGEMKQLMKALSKRAQDENFPE